MKISNFLKMFVSIFQACFYCSRVSIAIARRSKFAAKL
jgi:hypothetical protein